MRWVENTASVGTKDVGRINLKEKRAWKTPGIDGRISIQKFPYMKWWAAYSIHLAQDMGACFVWGFCEQGAGPSGSVKRAELLDFG